MAQQSGLVRYRLADRYVNTILSKVWRFTNTVANSPAYILLYKRDNMIVVGLLTCCNASKLHRINDDYDEYPHVDLPFDIFSNSACYHITFPLQFAVTVRVMQVSLASHTLRVKRRSQRSRSRMSCCLDSLAAGLFCCSIYMYVAIGIIFSTCLGLQMLHVTKR